MTIKKDVEKNEEDKGGKGGKAGDIEFRIFTAASRDDALPPTEMARLLRVHEELHKERVDTQKITRKEREELKKKGQKSAVGYDSLGLRGGSGGSSSPYKTHPISSHAQFSGATDKKVTGVPSDSLAQTNDDKRQELVAQLDLSLQLQQRFQHKNKPTSAPTLRRH